MPQPELWIVSQGAYSDYGVVCICPTQELAEAIAAKWNRELPRYEDFRAEAFPLVSSLAEAEVPMEYHVQVDLSGNEIKRWEAKGLPPSGDREGFGLGTGGVEAYSTRGYDVALKSARDLLVARQSRG